MQQWDFYYAYKTYLNQIGAMKRGPMGSSESMILKDKPTGCLSIEETPLHSFATAY